MDLRSDYESLCERYLLEELSESESEQLEKAYFSDDELFGRFLAVKDELLDAYARGDLKDKKLARFEEHYLATAARRERVKESRELIRVASAGSAEIEHTQSRPAKTHRFHQWQLFISELRRRPVMTRVGLVAALLAIVVGSWIAIRQVKEWTAKRATEPQAKKENVNQTAVPSSTSNLNGGTERASSSPSPLPPTKPDVSPKSPPLTLAQVASLTLLPLSTRETGSANTLTLSKEQPLVRLNLVVADTAYESFEVSVRTVDGQQVIRRAGLTAKAGRTAKTVTMTFDSSLLNRQDYIATVKGRRNNEKPVTVSEYFFSVQHTPPQSTATPPK